MRYQEPKLNIPNPPKDLPYEAIEDFYHEQLVLANLSDASEEGVANFLGAKPRSGESIVRISAANFAGAQGYAACLPVLEKLLGDLNDQLAVEAQYALIRLRP